MSGLASARNTPRTVSAHTHTPLEDTRSLLKSINKIQKQSEIEGGISQADKEGKLSTKRYKRGNFIEATFQRETNPACNNVGAVKKNHW